jgi:uncharacterized membrane protein (UPF0182 family)
MNEMIIDLTTERNNKKMKLFTAGPLTRPCLLPSQAHIFFFFFHIDFTRELVMVMRMIMVMRIMMVMVMVMVIVMMTITVVRTIRALFPSQARAPPVALPLPNSTSYGSKQGVTHLDPFDDMWHTVKVRSPTVHCSL